MVPLKEVMQMAAQDLWPEKEFIDDNEMDAWHIANWVFHGKPLPPVKPKKKRTTKKKKRKVRRRRRS